MGGLYDIIPGLREAEVEYRQTKLEAFAGIEPDVCGIFQVRPFTLQMLVELQLAENSFVSRATEPPSDEDLAQFLWRISIAFSRTDTESRRIFHHFLAAVAYVDAVDGIREYLARAFEATPLWPGGKGMASACIFPAKIVHDLASNYGWTEEYILNLPLRRLWQYENRIIEEKNREYAERSEKALRLRDDWLRKQNELARALPPGRN